LVPPGELSACSFAADDDFTASDGTFPDSDRWTRATTGAGICAIYSNELRMQSDPFTGTATLTSNAYYRGDNDIEITYRLSTTSTKNSVNFYIEVYNVSNSYWMRLYKGHTFPTPKLEVVEYDGSQSTTYTDTNALYSYGIVNFIRSGSSMACWVNPGSTPTGSVLRSTMANFGTGDIRFRIHFPLVGFSGNRFRFDDFTINGGTQVCL
jgi:hypothetical protein